MSFNPKTYWESRLSKKYSLAGVGDIRMPLSYNKVLYSLRKHAFQTALGSLEAQSRLGKVLDVGSGSGFYVDLWKKRGATVTGSDITNAAVVRLRERFPSFEFLEWDAGSDELPAGGPFDAISAFDVFFHIVDDLRYAKAISNVSSLLRFNGFFLYSDYFLPKEERRMEHIAFRSAARLQSIMMNNGLEEVARYPVFYMMNSPEIATSRVPRLAFKLLLRLAGRGEIWGALFGWGTYPLERLMLALTREATGTELVVYKKVR